LYGLVQWQWQWQQQVMVMIYYYCHHALLAYAELGKHHIQHVLGTCPASDLAQC
jgi:hypothetical protein